MFLHNVIQARDLTIPTKVNLLYALLFSVKLNYNYVKQALGCFNGRYLKCGYPNSFNWFNSYRLKSQSMGQMSVHSITLFHHTIVPTQEHCVML